MMAQKFNPNNSKHKCLVARTMAILPKDRYISSKDVNTMLGLNTTTLFVVENAILNHLASKEGGERIIRKDAPINGRANATWKIRNPGETTPSDPPRSFTKGKNKVQKVVVQKTLTLGNGNYDTTTKLHIDRELKEKLQYKARQLGISEQEASREAIKMYTADVTIDRELEEYVNNAIVKFGVTREQAVGLYNMAKARSVA